MIKFGLSDAGFVKKGNRIVMRLYSSAIVKLVRAGVFDKVLSSYYAFVDGGGVVIKFNERGLRKVRYYTSFEVEFYWCEDKFGEFDEFAIKSIEYDESTNEIYIKFEGFDKERLVIDMVCQKMKPIVKVRNGKAKFQKTTVPLIENYRDALEKLLGSKIIVRGRPYANVKGKFDDGKYLLEFKYNGSVNLVKL